MPPSSSRWLDFPIQSANVHPSQRSSKHFIQKAKAMGVGWGYCYIISVRVSIVLVADAISLDPFVNHAFSQF
jgi:hypothetical protein